MTKEEKNYYEAKRQERQQMDADKKAEFEAMLVDSCAVHLQVKTLTDKALAEIEHYVKARPNGMPVRTTAHLTGGKKEPETIDLTPKTDGIYYNRVMYNAEHRSWEKAGYPMPIKRFYFARLVTLLADISRQYTY